VLSASPGSGKGGSVRYMVIESYTHGPGPVYARAAERGRMLPPGLVYLESWIDQRTLDRCFQLMETEEPSAFDEWIADWDDLVEFEIVPVISSAEAAARLVG
jgi:Protein of unknown function (DUF3303)